MGETKIKFRTTAWTPTDKQVVIRQLGLSAWMVSIQSPNGEVWYDGAIFPSKKMAAKYVDKSPLVRKGQEYNIWEMSPHLERCRTIQ